MAALWTRAGHYIFIKWFLLTILSFFLFPRLFLAVSDWMSTILPHSCGLSAKIGRRSETCCTRLAEIQDTNNRQKFTICAPSHRTTLSGYIFATKTLIDNRKKNLVKQQYLTHMSSQYGGCPTTVSWGIPANFNGFRVLASLLQRRRSTEAN